MKYRLAALLIVVAVLLLQPFRGVRATNSESPGAIYSHGTLHVNVPYNLSHSGPGQLTVEVLDPEDRILGSSRRPVDVNAGKGSWQADFKLAKDMPVEDLVWHRVRYRFSYSDVNDAAAHGTDSISQILRTPVMHILGQQSYLTGGSAAVRVILTDSKNEVIAGPSSVRIDLLVPDSKPHVLFTGRLNQRGTTEAQFRFPAGLAGRYPLRYVVDTPIGSTEFTQQVRLEDKASILLTTGKPYLPARSDHSRARIGAGSLQSRSDGRIDVTYDRTHLAQDEIATATASIRNNLGKTANMVMVDLGIPPGFDILAEDLQDYLEKSASRKDGRLEKFRLTATQAILYFDSIAPGKTIKVFVCAPSIPSAPELLPREHMNITIRR